MRKLARNAQRGFGFYIGLGGRDEREGIRAIRIDGHSGFYRREKAIF
jgi:hypothetical protein